MTDRRVVRLFRIGRSQVLPIPSAFEMPGDMAHMRREGDRLVLEPIRRKDLLAVLATLEPLNEPFPAIDDPPPTPFSL